MSSRTKDSNSATMPTVNVYICCKALCHMSKCHAAGTRRQTPRQTCLLVERSTVLQTVYNHMNKNNHAALQTEHLPLSLQWKWVSALFVPMMWGPDPREGTTQMEDVGQCLKMLSRSSLTAAC